MNRLCCVLLSCILLCGLSGYSLAQEEGKDSTIDDLYIDYAIPDLTAFSLLGVNENQVSRPGSVKKLAAAILNTTGRDGNIRPGVAFEWGPGQTWMPKTLEEYRKSRLIRNMQISVATVKDGSGTDLGIGLRWVPINRSDPLLDSGLGKSITENFLPMLDYSGNAADKRREFLKSVRDFIMEDLQPEPEKAIKLLSIFEETASGTDQGTTQATMERLLEEAENQSLDISAEQEAKLLDYVEKAVALSGPDISETVSNLIKEKKKEFKKNSWNALAAQIALGTTLTSEDSSWGELSGDKLSSFAGVALPVSTFGQGILQVQYSKSYQDDAEEDWKLSAGGRLLLGGSDFRWSGEALYSRTKHAEPELDGSSLRATTGLEFKIMDGAWLEVAVGTDWPIGDDKPASEIITLANIKYALQRERRFNIH